MVVFDSNFINQWLKHKTQGYVVYSMNTYNDVYKPTTTGMVMK